MSETREFRRGMPREVATQAVVDVAVAYVDQLCAFNVLAHPEVHKQRLRLSEAVDAYHHSVPTSERAPRIGHNEIAAVARDELRHARADLLQGEGATVWDSRIYDFAASYNGIREEPWIRIHWRERMHEALTS